MCFDCFTRKGCPQLIVHTDRLKWPVAKQWESKSLITESSIYNKESKKSYQKRLVCGLPGPQ